MLPRPTPPISDWLPTWLTQSVLVNMHALGSRGSDATSLGQAIFICRSQFVTLSLHTLGGKRRGKACIFPGPKRNIYMTHMTHVFGLHLQSCTRFSLARPRLLKNLRGRLPLPRAAFRTLFHICVVVFCLTRFVLGQITLATACSPAEREYVGNRANLATC